MAVYTQFAAETVLAEAFASLGDAALLPAQPPTGTRLVLVAGGLQTIISGQGLQFDEVSGFFLSGTVTELELRFQGAPLFRFEQMSILATSLNDFSIFQAGLTGEDTLIGSPFADLLFGGSGSDTYRAGAGDDDLYGTAGADYYDGGTGLDEVLYEVSFSQVVVTSLSPSVFNVRVGDAPPDTLVDVEYASFTDRRVSLLELALGSPAANDVIGTEVYRFAKLDSGQYFYTGSPAERDQILASLPSFRFEGPVFKAQDNLASGYTPVYRFANLDNGGYFYTASAPERDIVFSSYPNLRYEGVSFFVSSAASVETVPVYRLANLLTGGYLFTASAAEREFAQSLNFFRDEGLAFNAPRNIALALGDPFPAGLAEQPASLPIAIDPVDPVGVIGASVVAELWAVG